ncbi:MAG: UvrD-helicase domain-containing protein [Bacteroidaceae bacterium]|nr:UvrD-helicase domain-containing protein [Bacteroidaceae bacterium]
MHPLKVYRASAGSGKTFTLAVEYIKLLVMEEGGGEYARILGVTFTNKATAEMKDRIVGQLYGIAHALPSSADYMMALERALAGEPGAPATEDEIRRRCALALRHILHDYSHFRVQTIDAFFQSVLRGLAHELGLTANLQVEISDTEVLSEAVDRIVDRLETEPVVLEWMMSLVRDQIDNNQRWDVTRQVKAFGRTIFSEDFQLRGAGLRRLLTDEQALRGAMRAIADEESHAIAAVRSWGNRLQEVIDHAGVDIGDFSNGSKLLAPLLRRLHEADLARLTVSATVAKWAADGTAMVKKADQKRRPDLMAAAEQIAPLLAALIDELPALQCQYNSSRLAAAHIKPLRLLDFIDSEVTHINSETSRFNLAKTPILLNQMIGKSDAPFIFEKIGARLHHIMIDEFQDTSSLQWRNFRPLLAECRSRGGRNLIVGDVKQSIYRFRGGDWRTLACIQDTVVPTPDVVNMGVNFRSERVVVDFNSDFFTTAVAIMDDASAEEEALVGGDFSFATAYYKLRQTASPKRMQQEPQGYVRVATLDSRQASKRADWEPIVLDDVCRQVAALHARGVAYRDMTILVRFNSDCQPIIDAFAARDDMPPVISDEAFLLSASSAVRTIMEALRWLDNDADPIAAFYLRTHLATPALWADLEEQAPALRQMPLPDLVEHLYRSMRLDAVGGQDAYMFTFLDAVADFVHSGRADTHLFIEHWDEKLCRQSIPATSREGIRVMSVHKSKGLEFNTVLIPFCSWRFEDNHGDILWTTPQQPPYSAFSLLPITPTAKMAPNSVFARDYAEERLNSRLDEFNALYVALTRARANLLVWSVSRADSDALTTVGDLVAATLPGLPEMADATDADTHPALAVSAMGAPCVARRKADDHTRMDPARAAVAVGMHSYDARLPFRQSSRSELFFETTPDDGSELADSEALRQSHNREFGQLLHAVLQQIATPDDIGRVLDAHEQEGMISRTAPDGTYVSIARRDLERRLRAAIALPQVAPWYAPGQRLFTECAIVCRGADGTSHTLRPDRVIVSADGRRITVVDYKTARPDDEHHRQVARYMHHLSRMYPAATVEGFLWYILRQEVVAVAQEIIP